MDNGKNQDGQVNAMDNGVATANNQDGNANAMYNGMAQNNEDGGTGQMSYNGNNNFINAEEAEEPAINTGTNGIAAQAEIEDNGAIAIGNSTAYYVGDESAMVIGAGNAVSDPSAPVAFNGNAVTTATNSAFATTGNANTNNGNGAINSGTGNAFGTVTGSAVNTGSGNNAWNSGNGAVAQGSSVAVGTVNQSPINVGAGNSALQNAPGAFTQSAGDATVNNGSQSAVATRASAAAVTVGTQSNIVQGSGSANSGSINSGGPAFGSNTASPSISPAPTTQAIQTVALTELKQVNTGFYMGNNNNNFGGGATINANSANSSSNGVLATSASVGFGANSAAQNVVNVTANTNRP
jgi:hypothetical protein